MSKAVTLPQRIRYWATYHGDRLAVDDGRCRLSYHELSDKVSSLSKILKARGVLTGDRVVIHIPKSCDAVVALLATLSLGAAYIPLDTKSPKDRTLSIVKDAKPKLIVYSSTKPPLDIEENYATLDMRGVENLESDQINDYHFCLENDAYVLYTSGSTGVPNGVRISHRAMIDFFHAVNVYMGVEQRSRCLNTSAIYFDVSVVDTLLPLYQGASVWLSPEFPMPLRIIELIEQEQITHLCGVGSTQTVLTSTPDFEQRFWPHLKTIMTGAEVLIPKTMQKWIKVAPNVHILNGYGPTEATCVCTVFTINAENVDKYETYPIGSPLPGISVLINKSNKCDTEQGELWITGTQLLSGYLNRPTLNENRIINVNGKRYYRTGDLVERDDQGKLIFLGRCDDQVKVRGYRIHLDDVATPFRNRKGINDAVAVNIKHAQLGECLAIIVSTSSSSDRWEELFESSKNLLPSHMRPKFWFSTTVFPLKPSGKVDAKLLRQLATSQASTLTINDNINTLVIETSKVVVDV